MMFARSNNNTSLKDDLLTNVRLEQSTSLQWMFIDWKMKFIERWIFRSQWDVAQCVGGSTQSSTTEQKYKYEWMWYTTRWVIAVRVDKKMKRKIQAQFFFFDFVSRSQLNSIFLDMWSTIEQFNRIHCSPWNDTFEDRRSAS
jgi:hypothetical protein